MSTSPVPDYRSSPLGTGAATAPAKIQPTGEQTAAGQRSETMRPIRVALILYRDDLNGGGSLRVAEVLADALDPTRVEAHIVFTYGGPGPVARHAKVPCHFVHSRGPADPRGWLRARRVMNQINPDILHFHNPVFWMHAALLDKHYKKIIHMHGPLFTDAMGWLERMLWAQTGRISDATVCISRGLRQTVLDLGWSQPERTWAVYNGIDCAAFDGAPSRHEAREMLGLPQDRRVIGVVCRLAWYKGCRDAIRILARLNPEWHLVFCGDGPMQRYLADVARMEGVAGRTHFAGMLNDMRPAYRAMDAFLFLSRLEPFGLVIAEAMAAKLPVFGLAAEGEYRDALYPLVTPQNSIFVERVSAGDYNSPEPTPILEELAGYINHFGTHPDSYQPMIRHAHKWVTERFDASVQAEAMFEVYDLAMGRPTDSLK